MTEASRSTVQAILPERRTAMAFALMFAVLAIGWRIPLPGLDLESVKPVYGEVPATLSIFALGLVPLFTILGYAEIAKLAVPQLTRWQTRSIRNARRFAVIVYAPSLVLAAWQGYGLLMALGAIDIVRSDAVGFAPAGLAAFIASTAVIVWLADDFGFSELGSSFWVLEFPSQASALIRPIQMGAISGGHVLIGGLSLVVGMALVVIANLLLSCNGRATGVAKTSILLWPPYLASVVAGYAFLLLPTEMPDWPLVTPSFFEIAHLTAVVVCIPVLVFAYARSTRLSQPDGLHPWPTLYSSGGGRDSDRALRGRLAPADVLGSPF